MRNSNPKDDPMAKFAPENRINDFLKKPTTKTVEDVKLEDADKRAYISKKLRHQPFFKNRLRWSSVWDSVQRHFLWRMKYFRSNTFMRFKTESAPLIIFCFASCLIAYKMQDNLDHLNRKIHKVKTIREETMEEENRLIDGYLNGNISSPNVQIRELLQTNRYKMNNDFDETEEDGLMQIPLDDGYSKDLDADEMKNLMEQYQTKTKELGYEVGPNPGYSLNALKNQKMIEKFKKQRVTPYNEINPERAAPVRK